VSLRRTRYIGQVKTHLGHVLFATGLNFLRLGEWFSDLPHAQTRRTTPRRMMSDT